MRLVTKTIEAFGSIDILVNNAGIIRRAPAAEYPEEYWDEIIAVNLNAVFRLSQLAARNMLKRGAKGKIVNIASLLSFQGGIFVPAYAAAKGGVAQLTKALANEWAAKGINVNAIAPGYMATDNTTGLRNDPVRNRQILERIPAGKWARRTMLPERQYSFVRKLVTTCTATYSRLTAAGSRVDVECRRLESFVFTLCRFSQNLNSRHTCAE